MKRKYLIAAAGMVAIAMAAAGTRAEMAKIMVENGEKIPQSLTGTPGNAENGRAVVIDRRKGNCLACHMIAEIKDQQFHGEVGPPLDDVGSRMGAGELRLRIVNPKIINPDTIMPAFYRTDGLHRVAKKWQGKTIVSAQEVEDMVAYMLTLKGSYSN
ncbi:MAG: sulfur oxidation c-type cytochrome SoxX [Hyphomicrobiales bacterium]|nr:sulfur oxidation c-type cytochrome SoxX [Hyphomicrobiales bacterium]